MEADGNVRRRTAEERQGLRRARCAYSITSPPHATDGCVRITVKAIPDGKVSNHVVRALRPGVVVRLDEPTGEFVLQGIQNDRREYGRVRAVLAA